MKKCLLEAQQSGRGQSFSSRRSLPPPNPWGYAIPERPDKPHLFGWSPAGVLEDYRKKRERNRKDKRLENQPESAFPGRVLENASIECRYWGQGVCDSHGRYPKWPDNHGRYWWETHYKDGSTRTEFYWLPDKERGYPEKMPKAERYWFIIYHAPTNTKIEGFCFEPDLEKDFPKREMSTDPISNSCPAPTYCSSETYHFFISYTECGAIKEWEEVQDRLYLDHLAEEQRHLTLQKHKAMEEANRFYFSKPWKLSASRLVKKSTVKIMPEYKCPISHQIMFDPVFSADGHTYEREEIEKWFEKNSTSPMTGQTLQHSMLCPNFQARSMIGNFLIDHPDSWQEVYASARLRAELFQLLAGEQAVDIKKWRSIIEKDRRFLAFPIGEEKILLLSYLCNQSEAIVKAYLPEMISMFTSTEWKAIATIWSVQDWIMLIAKACDTFSMLSLAEHFFKTLQQETDIKIDPIDMALYAIENRNISLFKLALSQVSDINQALEKGNTFLHIVAYKGEADLVKVLLEKGANIKQKNDVGLKPAAVAKEAGYEEISDQIEFYKIAPLLQRVGIFSRIETLEKTNYALENRLSKLEEMVAQRNSSAVARQIGFRVTPQ